MVAITRRTSNPAASILSNYCCDAVVRWLPSRASCRSLPLAMVGSALRASFSASSELNANC